MTHKNRFAAVLTLMLLSVRPGMAAIRLGTRFGEHMVLQQGVPIPIWGTGAPGGDTVRVSVAGQSVTAKSDWEGRWMVILAPMKAGGPYQMLIQVGGYGPLIPSSAANSRGVELNDVVIGEVRVMPPRSGATKNAIGGSKETAASGTVGTRSAWIRLFKAPTRTANEPQTGLGGQWTVASLDSADNDSAAWYAFASELHDKLHVPIGIIESPAGGSGNGP